MSFLKKRWVRISGGVLIFFICIVLLLPVGAKYYLTDWLEKNGADHATIEKLRFNPFAGRLTLGGVNVETGGKQLLTNADMVLDIGISSLINKNIRVQQGKYVGLMIDLEQYEDGRWRFGSYTMAASDEKAEVETVNEVETADDVASAWAFLADEVLLENCTVNLKMPGMNFSVVIEKAELKKFTTREEHPAGSFSLVGHINGEKVQLDLDTLQIVPSLRVGGMVHISRFKFEEIADILVDVLPTFGGEAGLGGKILFAMSEDGGMKVDYDGTIEIVTPDIGAAGFNTGAGNLKWDGKVFYDSPKNGPMLVETEGQLTAAEYSLQLPETELSNEETLIELTGKTRIEIGENIVVKNDGSLLVENSALALPGLSLSEESLSWKGQVIYDSDREGEGQYVHSDGLLELGPLGYTSGEEKTAVGAGVNTLAWQGVLTYSQKDLGRNSLVNLDGMVQGTGVYADLVEQKLMFSQENLKLISKLALTFGDKLDISGNSSFRLEDFSLTESGDDAPVVALDLLEVEELQGLGGKNISVKELLAKDLETKLKGNFPLDIMVPQIELADFVTEDLVNFKMAALGLNRPRIVSLLNSKELLHLGEIVISDILVGEGGSVNSDSVGLTDFVFLGVEGENAEKHGLTLSKAQLTGISWSGDDGFAGESLQFENLVTTIIRDKEGKINISQRLADMQVGKDETRSDEDHAAADEKGGDVREATAASASNEGEKGMPVRLGNILITGNSNIVFEDYTLAVPYITDLVITKFEIDELDSSRPDLKTDIFFQGELEKRAPVQLTGTLSPFKDKLAMDLKFDLKNYPLKSLSAYTVEAVGTALASGQLKLDTTLVLADDNLDMKNQVLLKKLETKMISKELAQELDNQLPIPLDSALSMLRDNNRDITLDVPLSGPVSDLSVGVGDVLVTALSKAIVPAASGYLMYALGPYGALAYVGMKVGENMLKVDFPPVEFVPGTVILSEEHKDYLERIAKILNDRPETDIQLCPRVASWEFMTESELKAIPAGEIEVREQDKTPLDELGQQRAIVVQEHLTATHSIDKGRLLVCETLIEKTKDTVPALLMHF